MNQSFFIKTYGCQMNEYDSEKLNDLLEYNGYKASKNFASSLNSDFCRLFWTFLSEKSTLFGLNFLQISDNFFLFEFAETPTT